MLRTASALFLASALLSATALGCGKKDDADKKPAATPSTPTTKTAPASPAVPEPDTLPNQWPALAIPDDNPQSAEKIALGHQLFFDTRLSVDGTRSCYSCHQNEHGNGGELPTAIGAKDKKLSRHSPVIWNVAFLSGLYWDGRAPTLEAQAKGAWGGGNMGVGKENLAAKAKEIGAIKGYATQFAKVFPKQGATPDTIAMALSAYERTLLCQDTAYDKYAKGDLSALDDGQKRGLALFLGKAQCSACHAPPTFSVAMGAPGGAYFNVGVGTVGVAEDAVDVGRMKVAKDETQWAAFKVPSLRHVSKSAPYFHDGSVADIGDAVKLMVSGGIDNKNKSKLVGDRGLTEAEIGDIVSFLGALDCGSLETPELPK